MLTYLAFALAFALQLHCYNVNKNKMIQILKKIPFFSKLSDADLQAIIEKIQMQYFPADHVIFNTGDPGDLMYIIKRGKVQVIRNNTILAVLSDNQFFGEMALVSDEPRNATVKTVTDLEVLTLRKEDFKRLLETIPSIASIVSYEVVKRANAIS
jgi:CRP-like cAMP-binding protein